MTDRADRKGVLGRKASQASLSSAQDGKRAAKGGRVALLQAVLIRTASDVEAGRIPRLITHEAIYAEAGISSATYSRYLRADMSLRKLADSIVESRKARPSGQTHAMTGGNSQNPVLSPDIENILRELAAARIAAVAMHHEMTLADEAMKNLRSESETQLRSNRMLAARAYSLEEEIRRLGGDPRTVPFPQPEPRPPDRAGNADPRPPQPPQRSGRTGRLRIVR